MYSISTITTTSIGYALSLSSNGKSRLGAGTSIYKDIAQLTPTCPKYVTADSIFSSNYLLSYYDEAQGAATISLFQLDNPKKTTYLSSSVLYNNVYDIATLDATSGLFVVINQDFDTTKDTCTIIAGKIDKSNNYPMSYETPMVYAGQYSIDPAITRLSDNSFAITYFDSTAEGSSILVTRYGNNYIISLNSISFFILCRCCKYNWFINYTLTRSYCCIKSWFWNTSYNNWSSFYKLFNWIL